MVNTHRVKVSLTKRTLATVDTIAFAVTLVNVLIVRSRADIATFRPLHSVGATFGCLTQLKCKDYYTHGKIK